MKKLITAASLVALLSATPALAADINGGLKDGPVDYSSDAPRVNWTGLWLAIEGGGLFANNTLGLNADFGKDLDANAEVDGLDSSGLYGEVGIGFDYQITQRIFVGIKGDLNIDNAEWKANFNLGDEFSGEVTSSRAWGGKFGPRVGLLVTPNTAVFLGGGVAYAEFNKYEATLSGGGESVSGDVFPDQETEAWGWYGELGLESHIQNGLFVRATGVYVDYEDLELFSASGEGSSIKLTDDREELIAKAGIVYKFGFGN